MNRTTGKYISISTTGDKAQAFLPHPLPPNPPLKIDKRLSELIRQCEVSLGELQVAINMIPDQEIFTYTFVRKEAILTSQIENIQATLTDLFNFESEIIDIENSNDIQEVCNYLEALKYSRKQIQSPKGLPVSGRLFNEIHKRLMKGVRGSKKNPGAIRKSQNWIGGTSPSNAHYIPPPPGKVSGCLNQLETYIHSSDGTHPLIKIGLIHAQFESIHPFLDGNGRLGRLLIAILLEDYGLASALSIYPSLHFKRYRNEYYQLLTKTRTKGDWESWILFFLQAIAVSAREATDLAKNLYDLHGKLRKKLILSTDTTIASVRLFELLPSLPILNLNRAVEALGVTKPTANNALSQLQAKGILVEVTDGKRNRVFAYKNYLNLLTKDTG